MAKKIRPGNAGTSGTMPVAHTTGDQRVGQKQSATATMKGTGMKSATATMGGAKKKTATGQIKSTPDSLANRMATMSAAKKSATAKMKAKK